jgi:hypothetical protein
MGWRGNLMWRMEGQKDGKVVEAMIHTSVEASSVLLPRFRIFLKTDLYKNDLF